MSPIRLALILFSLSACGKFAGKGDDPAGVDGGDGADGAPDPDSGDPAGTDADDGADTSEDRTVGGQALCAGGGRTSDGTHTAVTCIAPVEVALTTQASDGTHTLQAGPIRRISP